MARRKAPRSGQVKAAPRITIDSPTTQMIINYNAIIIDGPIADAATAFVRYVFDGRAGRVLHHFSDADRIDMMSLHIRNNNGKYHFTTDDNIGLPENWNEFVSIVQRICQLKAFW